MCPEIGKKSRIFVLLLCCAAVGSTASAEKNGTLEIRTLSNRADLVSGGDVLVEIVLPRHAQPRDVQVELNGRDIRHDFAVRGDGRFLGLVRGLSAGKNKL